MSKGPGALQRRVIDELAGAPGARLSWEELKRRFPHEAKQRSLHRAVRGLLARDLAYKQRIGERRYLGLTVSGDDELRGLVEAAFAQLQTVAKARGMPVPNIAEPSRESTRGHLRREPGFK